MVVEIARKIGKPATLVSKHLGVLRKTGVVAIKQRLHFIPRRFLSVRASASWTSGTACCGWSEERGRGASGNLQPSTSGRARGIAQS